MKRKKITINQIIYSIKGSLIINKLIIERIVITANGIIPFFRLNLPKLILFIVKKFERRVELNDYL